jgi:hypothetical protein
MNVQEALEEYLLNKMSTLCADRSPSNDVGAEANRTIDELGLFDLVTPFERVASTLGVGTVRPPRVIDDAPESRRLSVEHRYSLSPWPEFEFVILESEDGIAWAQAFARRDGVPVPVVQGVGDLARWSHVESEVRAALGTPISHEAWSPWETAVYRTGDAEFALCYVYGMLQSVKMVRRSETAEKE